MYLWNSKNSRGTANTYFEAFKRFLKYASSSATGKSVDTFEEAVSSFNLSLKDLQFEDFESYKGHLKQGGKSTSFIATEISALVCFLKFLKKRHHQPGIEILIENVRDLRPRITQKVPEAIEKFQVDTMIEAADNITEETLVSLLFFTGARIGEILNLRKEDIIYGEEQAYIKVLGKGDKERIIPLAEEAKRALEKYLGYLREKDELRRKYEGVDKKAGRSLFDMSYDTAWRMIKRVGERAKEEAGINKMHPHVLRHSFGCELLKRGANLRTIADLMGHVESQHHQEVYEGGGLLEGRCGESPEPGERVEGSIPFKSFTSKLVYIKQTAVFC